jgi:sterol desaturase/sphingolipid hydroxylase (fatty acid hydroxylase superfamily)
MEFWSQIFGNILTALVGPAAVTTSTNWGIVILIALVLLAAHDGGYWLHHWALHKSEVLWQIHKLHHSAEAMTPATEWRQHPIEQMWAATVISATTGFFYALVTHWFGTGAISMGVMQYSIITCIHVFTFQHLRHSHINMRFTGVVGVIFHSPAHHQIHHSDNPTHFDRNLGYFLSIWDWMAGTLYMPRAGETISPGLGPDESEYEGIVDAMWVPIRDAAIVIRRLLAAPFLVRRVRLVGQQEAGLIHRRPIPEAYQASPVERATPTTLSAAP